MKKTIKILNNTLTTLRLIASLFMINYVNVFGFKYAALISLLLFLTDLIDGFVARYFGVQSFYGCLMDAVSDKVLSIISLIILSKYSILVLLPLIIEILILITNILLYRNGYNVKSFMSGKIKTWGIGLLIVGGYLSVGILNNPKTILIILSILSTCFSTVAFLDYLKTLINSYKYKSKNKTKDKKKNKLKNIKELYFSFFDTNYYLKNKDESILKLFYKGN